MSLIDYLVVIIPLALLIGVGVIMQRYVRNVADFLAAGRLAGRYLISVADGTACMGLISIIGMLEWQFRAGWALSFWSQFGLLVALFMTLTGFVAYRYRETRAMTMAEFFEMRYSRGFRIFAGCIAFISGVVNYALFPAVAGRFFLYYTGIPSSFPLFGVTFSTFGVMMALFLSVALFIVMRGGQLTTLVTDCLQGIFSYIAYAIIVFTILSIFSISEVREAVMARPVGESFFNPFNIGNLTNFNILFVMINMFAGIYTRNAWLGNQGYYCAGASPHEQKMAGVLGTWRSGFMWLMITILVIGSYTYMHSSAYSSQASAVYSELADRITVSEYGSEAVVKTIQNQMLVPVALRHMLPVGVVGVFCALMLFLMVSTDTTYMHSWASILVQDIILPCKKRSVSPKTQLFMLRAAILGIAIFAWVFSFYFGQVDFIVMFMALTGSIYAGGAGSVIIGGLYWKKGTTAGAYAAMISGAVLGATGFLIQQYWSSIVSISNTVIPGAMESFRLFLFNLGNSLPIVQWEVTPEKFAEKFPISGQEIYMIGMLTAIALYVTISLMTCKKAFNLDRMLHRGIYNLEHFVASDADKHSLSVEEESQISLWKRLKNYRNLLGITPEYTKTDRMLAWSIVIWTFWGIAVFLFQLISNTCFGVWSEDGWYKWYLCYELPFALTYGVITTIWFTIGGSKDIIKLFKALNKLQKEKVDNSDNGQISTTIE